MKLHEKLLEYLDQIGFCQVSLRPHPEASLALPLFLSQAYDAYAATIFGKIYTLLLAHSADRPTPAQAVKQIEVARRALGFDVAFVFPAMPSFDRKRFVERGVPFIVPGKQTFLPMVLIDLRATGSRAIAVDGAANDNLSAPAQSVLLYYLQHPDAREWSLTHWADELGYAQSTMTRVRAELVSHDLCGEIGKGRSLLLAFPGDRRALWQKVEPRMESPVRARHHVLLHGGSVSPQLLRSGFSALADLSMLTRPPEDVYAVYSPKFSELIGADVIQALPAPVEESVVVERWRYNPLPLSDAGERVDRLSLVLSLRDNHDERVQGALSEILEGMPW